MAPMARAAEGKDAARLRAASSASTPTLVVVLGVVGLAVGVVLAAAAFSFAWSCLRKKPPRSASPPRTVVESVEPDAVRFDRLVDERPAALPVSVRQPPPAPLPVPVPPPPPPSTQPLSSSSSNASTGDKSPVQVLVAMLDDPSIQAVRVSYDEIHRDALLSRGGYGEVYRGVFRHQLVAIKTLLPQRRKDPRQVAKFLAEVKLMAALEHKRIVRFLGVAWDARHDVCVVAEFMERGDLRTVLFGFDNDGQAPGFDEAKIRIARHVAHGLAYMHSRTPSVLHRDLKSRNILLDAGMNAKLTDFGVSRERADDTMTAVVGTYLWMAPEVLTGQHYDEKADIFSLGIVLSELDTHTVPYEFVLDTTTDHRIPDRVLLEMVSHGRLQVAFTDDHAAMTKLARKCLSVSPDERPTASDVLKRITQVWHLVHMSN